MKLTIVSAGNFKLDGGAMFGVVPKVMWNKMNPADENNMCTWTMRSLLIETETRKILVDTGIGNKQGEKFRSHFHPVLVRKTWHLVNFDYLWERFKKSNGGN